MPNNDIHFNAALVSMEIVLSSLIRKLFIGIMTTATQLIFIKHHWSRHCSGCTGVWRKEPRIFSQIDLDFKLNSFLYCCVLLVSLWVLVPSSLIIKYLIFHTEWNFWGIKKKLFLKFYAKSKHSNISCSPFLNSALVYFIHLFSFYDYIAEIYRFSHYLLIIFL